MTPALQELIALHTLDLLDPSEAAEAAAAIAGDAELATEFASLRETVHRLGASAPRIEPSPDVEAQLMASVGGGRLERFVAAIARLYDFSTDRAREVLSCIERQAVWQALLPNVDVIHFEGGPSCATADCGAVRIRAGGVFPVHTHRGKEMSVIVAGVVRDSDGSVYRPGDEIVQNEGTSHTLTAEGSDDAIVMARAFNGIELARVRQP